ncbi:MAG: hypothetical protein R8G01_17030 [Ilumatobacteraceae bacterium]|nr:hypothetical protein [Ilumatobacteraceae bacterium]
MLCVAFGLFSGFAFSLLLCVAFGLFSGFAFGSLPCERVLDLGVADAVCLDLLEPHDLGFCVGSKPFEVVLSGDFFGATLFEFGAGGIEIVDALFEVVDVDDHPASGDARQDGRRRVGRRIADRSEQRVRRHSASGVATDRHLAQTTSHGYDFGFECGYPLCRIGDLGVEYVQAQLSIEQGLRCSICTIAGLLNLAGGFLSGRSVVISVGYPGGRRHTGDRDERGNPPEVSGSGHEQVRYRMMTEIGQQLVGRSLRGPSSAIAVAGSTGLVASRRPCRAAGGNFGPWSGHLYWTGRPAAPIEEQQFVTNRPVRSIAAAAPVPCSTR